MKTIPCILAPTLIFLSGVPRAAASLEVILHGKTMDALGSSFDTAFSSLDLAEQIVVADAWESLYYHFQFRFFSDMYKANGKYPEEKEAIYQVGRVMAALCDQKTLKEMCELSESKRKERPEWYAKYEELRKEHKTQMTKFWKFIDDKQKLLSPPKHLAEETASAPANNKPAPTLRMVQASELPALADKGRMSDPLLLTGAFRVSSATSNHAIIRPSDAALAGQIRVMVTLHPSTSLLVEGASITLTDTSRYFVREVRRSADGQFNVEVEQR
jgi:hypothetical protein